MFARWMRVSWLIFCLLWILGAVGLATLTGLGVYRHPYNGSPYDQAWLAGFAATLFVMALLAPLFRGRLLLAAVTAALTGLVAAGIALSGQWLAFLTLGWLIALAAMLGRRLLRLAAREWEAGTLERSALSIGLGLAALVVPVGVAGYTHLLYPKLFGCGLLALTLLLIPASIRPFMRVLAAAAVDFRRAWRGEHLGLAAFALGAAALGLMGALAWALAPAMQFDSLAYHLGIPQIYLRLHAITLVPEYHFNQMIFNGEMLYTLTLLLGGQPLPALLHWVYGVLTCLLLFALARDLGGRRAAWLALLLFGTVPEVTVLAGWAFTDLTVTFYTLAMLYSFFRWWQGRERAWLILIGVFGGVSASTKLNAFFVITPVCLVTAALLARRHGLWSPAFLKDLGRLGLPLAVLGLPWMIRNAIQTGSPVFPFLNSIFSSPLYNRVDHDMAFGMYGMGKDLRAFLSLPWDLVRNTARFGEVTREGELGCIPLLVLPWAYPFLERQARSRVRLLIFLILAFLALWINVAAHVRYMVPALPLCVVLGALCLDGLWGQLNERLEPFPRHYFLFVALFFVAIPYLALMRSVDASIHYEDPQRYPLNLWRGVETADLYLTRHLPSREALQFIDRLGSEQTRILAVGMPFRLYTQAHLYGTDRKYISAKVNNALFDELAARKFDYLLLDKTRVETRGWNPTRVARYVELLYSRNNFFIYDLKRRKEVNENVVNLLVNPGLEQRDAKGGPAGYFKFGRPLAGGAGGWAHQGSVAVRVDVGNGFFQVVPVVAGQQYTLGLWANAERPGSFVRVQVNWYSAARKPLNSSITPFKATSQWAFYQGTMKAPAGAAYAYIYANSHARDAWVWIDDLVFARGDVDALDWEAPAEAAAATPDGTAQMPGARVRMTTATLAARDSASPTQKTEPR